jgi:hypothetical protein
MYSVIIPTLWKCNAIHKLLFSLDLCKEVGEIILIDNSDNPPEYLGIDKIVHIKEYKNTYVNPAWNKGVSLAKYDNIAIINDDLCFPMDVFNYVKNHMDKGVIGMYAGNYDRINMPGYQIEKMGLREWGWGCVIFIKKQNWVNIPDDLLIACGDDYLIKNVNGGGWMLKNLEIEYEQVSRTSILREFFEQQDNDIKTFNEKYR